MAAVGVGQVSVVVVGDGHVADVVVVGFGHVAVVASDGDPDATTATWPVVVIVRGGHAAVVGGDGDPAAAFTGDVIAVACTHDAGCRYPRV